MEKGIEVPGYTVNESGIFKHGKEGAQYKICLIPIHVTGFHSDLRGRAEIELSWVTPLGTTYRANMPMVLFADGRSVARWLYRNAICGFTSGHAMMRYLEAAQMVHAATPTTETQQ